MRRCPASRGKIGGERGDAAGADANVGAKHIDGGRDDTSSDHQIELRH